jgi:predicted amidophosphoribosyltransferase
MDPASLRVWLRRRARELARALLDCACPPTCPACGAASDGLCAPCAALLETRRAPWCARCGEPLPAAGEPCPADHGPLRGLLLARAPLRYRGTGGRIVRRFKFQRDPVSGAFLARAMAAAQRPWARGPGRRAVVVAVPMHPRKRRRRRLDQAARLAEAAAARLRLRTAAGALRRCRDTLPQGDPRVMSREANVRGAFAVRRPRAVAGRLVVLVDDVATSLHTARECAAVLRAAGARGVVLLTAAESGRRGVRPPRRPAAAGGARDGQPK